MEQTKSQNKVMPVITKAVFLVLAMFLVVYLITVVVTSTRFFKDTAERSALLYLQGELDQSGELVREHYDNLYEIADQIKFADNRTSVEDVLVGYIGSEQFGDLRYYAQGVAYAANGMEVAEETSGKDMISALVTSNTEGCTGIYYDKPTTEYCIALFVPVRGSVFADGLLSILPARDLLDMSKIISEGAVNVSLMAPDGKVFATANDESFAVSTGNDYYAFINKLTNDKSDLAVLGEKIALTESTAFTVDTPEGSYVFALSPISHLGNKMYIVTMRESAALVTPELTYIRHVVNLLAIAMIIVVAVFTYTLIFRKKAKEALVVATLTDTRLECPNAEAFRINARETLAVSSKYAVMSISIHNFHFHSDVLGEVSTVEVLKFITKTFDTFKEPEECYGYSGDGKFLFLKHFSTERALSEWVKLISSLLNKNEELQFKKTKIKLDIGVFKVFEERKQSVAEMIECANAACVDASENLNVPFMFYSEEVKEQRVKREQIESQMERALENEEFRVFLQPKYSVKHDRIDSAEALVRWFDPQKGEYMFPGEFIAQFESNGFVAKLDHFVYIKVLEYLSEAAEKGEKIVPVSVNVSRVTASRDDFLSFYIENKQKYRVGDDFIVLEITESFAMDDYEKISYIVERLHEKGIGASIDDFGSGYSSFNVIRRIYADELKLDRSFLQKSSTIERDEKVLATVIDLGKSLGMKVVQEGVETKEDFERVIAKGCDVIQGYYYAKAIPLSEYKIFVNSNTSIKYKSLVK